MKKLVLFALGLGVFCFSGCKEEKSDLLEVLSSDLTTGTWSIAELVINNDDLTSQFEHYRLTFTLEKDPDSPQEIFNKLILTGDSISVNGTWIFMAAGPEEDYDNFLSVAFVNNIGYQPISARWGIESHTEGKVELIKEAEELSTERRVMVLEKQ